MSTVVIVSRDSQDRTVVSWYEDENGWRVGDHLAEIVAAQHIDAGPHVDIFTANRVADTWIVLLQVPGYDVSYLATHVVVDGELQPVDGRAA